MNTKAQPTNAAEAAEVDFGMQLVRRLVGGSVVAFGANENGEVYLSVKKEGQITEVLIGVDERGEPAVFEVERQVKPETPAAPVVTDEQCGAGNG